MPAQNLMLWNHVAHMTWKDMAQKACKTESVVKFDMATMYARCVRIAGGDTGPRAIEKEVEKKC